MKRKNGERSPAAQWFFDKRKRMRSVYGWLDMGEMQYVLLTDAVSIEKELNLGINGEVEYDGGYTVKQIDKNVYLAFNEHYSLKQKNTGKKPNWIINGIEVYAEKYMIFEVGEFNEVVDLSKEKFEKIKIERP